MKIPKEFEDVFHGVELTEDEIRTLTWIVGWESRTVENLRSAIQKAQATALSTLQAENKRLNKIVCSIPTTPDGGRTVSQYDKEMSMCAYLDDLEAENEKLRVELEQVKAERDAAISDLETIMAYGGGNLDTCQYCKNGQCYARGGTKLCLPQWRGQKED